MGTAAVICYVLVFAITGVIVLTEGVPREPRYVVLTLLMLFVPILSTVVLVRKRRAPQGSSTADDGSSMMTPTARAAVLCNVVLLGASCWAAVAQHPYAEGASVIPFAVLAVCTPVLSLMALLSGGRSAMPKERRSTAGSE